MKLVYLTLCILPAGFMAADVLSNPVNTIRLERAFAPGSNIPKWQNGLLITSEDHRVPARVQAFDRTGQVITEASITFPDAIAITLEGLAVSPTGELAVGGTMHNSSGAGATFIALIGRGAAIERVVQTPRFASFQLCFASDETLWAFGRVRNADFTEAQQYDMLRHYSRDGTLLGSLLPRQSFIRYAGPHPAVGSFLVPGADRIGLYTPNSKEWIEIANSGAVLGRWKGLDLGSDPKDLRVTGAALTPEGSVYVSAVLRRSGSSSPSTQFHTLDRKTGTWLAVDASSLLGPGGVGFAAILGNDGGNLVINRQADLLFVPPLATGR